ncbi:MAG: hypothetical protein E6559_21570, partial [Pantoea sp.]|nr:hypothetical protein [Pantoea sp.]
ENQDAFKLAVAYMERKENVTGITVYFKSFIETYQKFDRWLSAADPVQAVEEEKKAAKANPDSLL